MTRGLTAVFAAFEALLVVAVGVAIPLTPLTLLWGIQYGLSVDWAVFWRVAVDAWLLGHGVDVTATLDAAAASTLGSSAGQPVTLTIALLGFALLTVLLAVRAGRRVAETPHLVVGAIASLGTVGAASFALTFSALHPALRPSLVQGTLLPVLVFATGFAIGVLREARESRPAPTRFASRMSRLTPAARAVLGTALRGGVATAAAILAAAAVLTGLALALSYARIIGLYEALHGEVLGGAALTLGQIAILPNLVIWAASWLIGPGFAIGAGSSVGPIATHLGPIPGIPVLGALPEGQLSWGFLGLIVPVVAAFLVASAVGPRVRSLGVARQVLCALGIGVVGGAILGVLGWASGGAAGPGRLAQVGPDPLAVAGWAALELSVGAVVGLLAGARRGTGPAAVIAPSPVSSATANPRR